MTFLRSLLFLLGAVPITAVFGVGVPISGLFGKRAALWMAREWARWMVRW
jgi:hypothetical protein